MDPIQIVNALVTRAKRVGLSMATVCSRAEVAESTVSRWKKGDFEPRLKVLAKLDKVISEEERLVAERAAPAPDRVLSASL